MTVDHIAILNQAQAMRAAYIRTLFVRFFQRNAGKVVAAQHA